MISRSRTIAALLLLPLLAMTISLTACTSEYARQQSEELAEQARLLDAIDVKRQNQRVLSRQAQICLLSAEGGDETGANLLRTIQVGFSGYFVAVGVVGESVDYLRAASGTLCPGASYLLYIQPSQSPVCKNSNEPCSSPSQFNITVISGGDLSLVDRIRFSIKKSFLPIAVNERERNQKAFEQLAIVLTGSE